MQLQQNDWSFIFLYVAILIFITWKHTKKSEDANDFLLASRQLTLPIFVATLVSTWYGGIFAVSEMVGWYGLGAWLIQGVFWYIVYFIFALLLAKKITQMPFYTIPDILENHFGKKAAFIGGIFTYIMINPAPYLLSLGVIIAYFSGLSLFSSIIIATIFCIIYTSFAGFKGVVYTDAFQFIWMFVSFIILFSFCLHTWGGIDFLKSNLPVEHVQITGGMKTSLIFVWAGLACWVFVDPNFYQRCLAAKSPNVARNGILVCILFWFVFDIVAIGSAMYAFAAHNNGILTIANPQHAYLDAASYLLPSPLKGLFLAGIISTIMSTTDSFLFVAAVNISRDYYWRYLKKEASDEDIVYVTRLAILFTAVLAAFLALQLPYITQLWYILGYLGLSGLLIPTLYTFWFPKTAEYVAISSMLVGFTSALLWLIDGMLNMTEGMPKYWMDIEPLYPGIATSLSTLLIALMINKKAK